MRITRCPRLTHIFCHDNNQLQRKLLFKTRLAININKSLRLMQNRCQVSAKWLMSKLVAAPPDPNSINSGEATIILPGTGFVFDHSRWWETFFMQLLSTKVGRFFCSLLNIVVNAKMSTIFPECLTIWLVFCYANYYVKWQ